MKRATKTTATSVLSVRLDLTVRRRLERLAKATDRTSAWLIHDAVTSYLETQEWQVQAIEESVRDADARPERSIPHERVRAWVESWGAKRERGRPR